NIARPASLSRASRSPESINRSSPSRKSSSPKLSRPTAPRALSSNSAILVIVSPKCALPGARSDASVFTGTAASAGRIARGMRMATVGRVGVLNDMGDGPDTPGDVTDWLRREVEAVQASGRLDAEVEFVHAWGLGLPSGTAAAVERAFLQLVRQDVAMIVGP